MSYLSKRCLSSSILNTLNKKTTWGLNLSKSIQTEQIKKNTIGTQTLDEESVILSSSEKDFIKKVKSEGDLLSPLNLRTGNRFSIKKRKTPVLIYHLSHFENCHNKTLINSPSRIPIPKWRSPEDIKTFLKNNTNRCSRVTLNEPPKKTIKVLYKNKVTSRKGIRFPKSKRPYYGTVRTKKVEKKSSFLENKMRSYSMFIFKWAMKFFKMVTDIASSMKIYLRNAYEMIQNHEIQLRKSTNCCMKYQISEIETLHSRIQNLETEFTKISHKTKQTDENSENITELKNNYDKLNEEVNALLMVNAKFEREVLEKQLNCSNAVSSESVSFSCPPPPPPLPPPTILNNNNFCSPKFIRVITKNDKCFDRPLITLEDILKVKLKKITSA